MILLTGIARPAAYDRALMLAWTQAQIQLRHLSIDTEEAHLYQTLASHLIYANAALRAPAKTLLQGMGPAIGALATRHFRRLAYSAGPYRRWIDIELIRQLLHAFEYWKTKSLEVDLVILNDRGSSYAQDLQGAIEALVRKISVAAIAQRLRGDMGQVFTLRADLLSQETLRVLPAVARVVLFGRRGDLASQLSRATRTAVVSCPAGRDEPLRLLPQRNPLTLSTKPS